MAWAGVWAAVAVGVSASRGEWRSPPRQPQSEREGLLRGRRNILFLWEPHLKRVEGLSLCCGRNATWLISSFDAYPSLPGVSMGFVLCFFFLASDYLEYFSCRAQAKNNCKSHGGGKKGNTFRKGMKTVLHWAEINRSL